MATTVTLKPNAIDISGSTSGTTTLQATAVAGTTTLTLPAATDTLVGKATTDTLTNKTLTSPTITGGALNGTVGATTPSTGAFTTVTASGLVSATNAIASFKAIHLGTVTEFSTLNYDGISTAVVDRYDAIPAGKSYFTYVGASAITTLSSTGLAVTGTISGTTTIGVGAATPSTSGAGITFPATQSASSNANTLDDYEEGSWTYDFTATTGTITKSATYLYGYYTKVGRVVTITGFLQVASVSSPTGVLTLTGLPFPIASTGSRENFVGGGIYGSSLSASSVSPLMVSGSAGSSSLTISKFVTGSSANLAGDVVADTRFQISFTYFTD